MSSLICGVCGARQVGRPLTPPDVVLPKLGLPFSALFCAILIVVAFLALWIFGNEMKVGRAMLVWAIGISTKLTKPLLETEPELLAFHFFSAEVKHSLLLAEPKLLSYRIFSFDAYKAAFILSFGAIPVSMLGIWLARRAKRLAILAPAQYGGLGLARVSYTLTTCLFLGFSTVAISSIPDLIARSHAKRIAATQAKMYEIHANALQKYYREYGAYPMEFGDLSKVNVDTSPGFDDWNNSFAYEPVAEVASNGSSSPFTNYKLVSAGPDGKFQTADDIVMIDGLVVESNPDQELPTTPEKPRP